MRYDDVVYQLRKHRNVDRYEFVAYSPSVHIGEKRPRSTMTYDELSEAVGSDYADCFDSKPDRFLFQAFRAKKCVRDLVYNNDWKYFFTQTFSPEHDRYSIDDTVKKFLRFLSDFNCDNKAKGKKSIKYLFVPERHHDGAWHLHGLVSDFPDLVLYRRKDFKRLPLPIIKTINSGKKIYYNETFSYRFGYCTFSPVQDVSRIGTYLSKYILKQLDTGQNLSFGKHRYYASKGLNGPLQYEVRHCCNSFLNQGIFLDLLSGSFKHKMTCQKNDFYYKMILSGSEMKSFLSSVRGLQSSSVIHDVLA